MKSSLDDLRVVLVAPRNPLNIGAVARAMSNFGVNDLRVVNPYEVAFRDAKSAVGASPLLAAAKEFNNIAEAVADCAWVVGTTAIGHRDLQQPVKVLVSGARSIRAKLVRSPVAILFGSEKWGLSNDALSHCHWVLHIPTREEHQSMNLGQAVAVCLYELSRNDLDRSAAPPRSPQPATGVFIEQITQLLLDALERSGYVNPKTAGSAQDKTRRLVRRLDVSARDAPVLLGMLRQILWKLNAK